CFGIMAIDTNGQMVMKSKQQLKEDFAEIPKSSFNCCLLFMTI
ncbi:hypothetical protein PSX40_23690, partial [Shigella flexneri]|nr:hypothetical protein [Shigella flexneri]